MQRSLSLLIISPSLSFWAIRTRQLHCWGLSWVVQCRNVRKHGCCWAWNSGWALPQDDSTTFNKQTVYSSQKTRPHGMLFKLGFHFWDFFRDPERSSYFSVLSLQLSGFLRPAQLTLPVRGGRREDKNPSSHKDQLTLDVMSTWMCRPNWCEMSRENTLCIATAVLFKSPNSIQLRKTNFEILDLERPDGGSSEGRQFCQCS